MMQMWGSGVAGHFNGAHLQLYSNIGVLEKTEMQMNMEV